jgi:hypothetical protein
MNWIITYIILAFFVATYILALIIKTHEHEGKTFPVLIQIIAWPFLFALWPFCLIMALVVKFGLLKGI